MADAMLSDDAPPAHTPDLLSWGLKRGLLASGEGAIPLDDLLKRAWRAFLEGGGSVGGSAGGESLALDLNLVWMADGTTAWLPHDPVVAAPPSLRVATSADADHPPREAAWLASQVKGVGPRMHAASRDALLRLNLAAAGTLASFAGIAVALAPAALPTRASAGGADQAQQAVIAVCCEIYNNLRQLL